MGVVRHLRTSRWRPVLCVSRWLNTAAAWLPTPGPAWRWWPRTAKADPLASPCITLAGVVGHRSERSWRPPAPPTWRRSRRRLRMGCGVLWVQRVPGRRLLAGWTPLGRTTMPSGGGPAGARGGHGSEQRARGHGPAPWFSCRVGAGLTGSQCRCRVGFGRRLSSVRCALRPSSWCSGPEQRAQPPGECCAIPATTRRGTPPDRPWPAGRYRSRGARRTDTGAIPRGASPAARIAGVGGGRRVVVTDARTAPASRIRRVPERPEAGRNRK